MSASTDALLSKSARDGKQRLLFKDEILGSIAEMANVAQFVSFSPDLKQRLSRVWHYEPNHVFPSPAAAIAALLKESPEESVNVCSFDPKAPESREFVYGLRSVEDVLGRNFTQSSTKPSMLKLEAYRAFYWVMSSSLRPKTLPAALKSPVSPHCREQ